MKINKLNIFPVKSLGGFSVQSAILTAKGLQYDRNWMVLDENGMFMTQRTFPEMALIATNIKDGNLIFTHRSTEKSAFIPIKEKYSENIVSKIWRNDCEVQKVSTTIDETLSEMLNKKVHLVFFPKENIRTKKTKDGLQKNIASLADKSPLLVANEASLEELNSRLEEAVPMSRFRANVIYKDQKPWEEDLWKVIKIGNTTCPIVELCGRCPLINVDQLTAKKGTQPLEMLTSYRENADDRQIKFGMRVGVNLVGEEPVVNIGDVISVEV